MTSLLFCEYPKLWGQYYRDVLATPDGTDHQNIRNFMKVSNDYGMAQRLRICVIHSKNLSMFQQYGWDGVDFSNGISLTKKAVGESDWDWDSESWIP